MSDEENKQNITEAPLSRAQRLKRARTFRRIQPKLKRKRELLKFKPASQEKIQKKARKAAIATVRQKVAGQKGADYANLSTSEKINVDKQLEKRKGLIDKIARRSIPKVRKKDRERIASLRRTRNENVSLEEKALKNLERKAEKYNVPFEVIEEVYARGLEAHTSGMNCTKEQWAFSRVDSFVNEGWAFHNADKDLAVFVSEGYRENERTADELLKQFDDRLKKKDVRGFALDLAKAYFLIGKSPESALENYALSKIASDPNAARFVTAINRELEKIRKEARKNKVKITDIKEDYFIDEGVLSTLSPKASNWIDKKLNPRFKKAVAYFMQELKKTDSKTTPEQLAIRVANDIGLSPRAFKEKIEDMIDAKAIPNVFEGTIIDVRYQLFLEESAVEKARDKIAQEKEADAKKNDRALDRARTADTRRKNRETNPNK